MAMFSHMACSLLLVSQALVQRRTFYCFVASCWLMTGLLLLICFSAACLDEYFAPIKRFSFLLLQAWQNVPDPFLVQQPLVHARNLSVQLDGRSGVAQATITLPYPARSLEASFKQQLLDVLAQSGRTAQTVDIQFTARIVLHAVPSRRH